MLKFDEQKQLDSVNGALALRGQIESIVDDICKKGYRNICWLGMEALMLHVFRQRSI